MSVDLQNVATRPSFAQARVEDSLPARLFPDLDRNARIDNEKFQFISVAFSSFGPDIWLYRLRNFN